MKYFEERKKRREFETLTMPHFDSLYNTARWMIHDEIEAEDLIQETYLKAYRSFDHFPQGTDCKAWLFQILRNTFINAYNTTLRL